MGKGDKKSRKGKIFMGTYGVTRPRKTAEVIVITKKNKAERKEEVTTKAATKKKVAAKNKTITKKTSVKKK
jgi:ribosomal small subunit protein bTHX